MKKLLLIGLICLTGCSNPISSQIDKEGDKTRAEIAIEMDAAKQQISNELNQSLASSTADLQQIINQTLARFWVRL